SLARLRNMRTSQIAPSDDSRKSGTERDGLAVAVTDLDPDDGLAVRHDSQSDGSLGRATAPGGAGDGSLRRASAPGGTGDGSPGRVPAPGGTGDGSLGRATAPGGSTANRLRRALRLDWPDLCRSAALGEDSHLGVVPDRRGVRKRDHATRSPDGADDSRRLVCRAAHDLSQYEVVDNGLGLFRARGWPRRRSARRQRLRNGRDLAQNLLQ